MTTVHYFSRSLELMLSFHVSLHGTQTTYNLITAVPRQSWSSWLQSTLAVSYPPGSTLVPHASTKRPPSTCHLPSLLLWHPPVLYSISAPAMRESAGRFRVFCSRAMGMRVGTHPKSGEGLETVIRGLSTPCRKSYQVFIVELSIPCKLFFIEQTCLSVRW